MKYGNFYLEIFSLTMKKNVSMKPVSFICFIPVFFAVNSLDIGPVFGKHFVRI